jgi:hypothetical protein
LPLRKRKPNELPFWTGTSMTGMAHPKPRFAMRTSFALIFIVTIPSKGFIPTLEPPTMLELARLEG